MTNPLVHLGDLTKPATVLVEKISDAVGGIFKPFQIVRVAKAQAEANRIQVNSDIEITDLHRRAMQRFLQEESAKQLNIEAITREALPLLKDNSNPQNVSDDWITNFFEKSRIISDKDMQKIWSKVLAGEANTPGTFSKRTVNLLSDFDKFDAELFMCLCGFNWVIDNLNAPLVFDFNLSLYRDNMINFYNLAHLESLGLIRFDVNNLLRTDELSRIVTTSYYGTSVQLTFSGDQNNSLGIGAVIFTRAGQELAAVCGGRRVEGFFEFVCDQWARIGLLPNRSTEQSAGS